MISWCLQSSFTPFPSGICSPTLIPLSINQAKLNLPVFSTYSSVSFTSFGSPSRFSTLMFLLPTFFLNSFLGPSWFLHSRRKCFTFSIPRPQLHVGSSMMLCRFRWLFSRQWPVRSLIRFASCFRESGRRIVVLLFWLFVVGLACGVVSRFLFHCSMFSWLPCWCRRLFLWPGLLSACDVGGLVLPLAFPGLLFSLLRRLSHFQQCPCDLAPIQSWIRGLAFGFVVRPSFGGCCGLSLLHMMMMMMMMINLVYSRMHAKRMARRSTNRLIYVFLFSMRSHQDAFNK